MTENSTILEVNLNNDEALNIFDGYSYIESLYVHDIYDVDKFINKVKDIQIKNLGFGHLSINKETKFHQLDKSLEIFYVGHPDGFGADYNFMVENVLYPQFVKSFGDEYDYDPEIDDEHFQGYQDTFTVNDLSFLNVFENLKEISISITASELDFNELKNLTKLEKIEIRGRLNSNIKHQGNLTSVRELTIQTPSIRPFIGFTNLKKLNIEGIWSFESIKNKEYHFDIGSIDSFQHLEELTLLINETVDTRPLGKLKALKKINISERSENSPNIDLSFLNKLINLEELEFNNYSFDNFRFLNNLSHLKKLAFKNCNWNTVCDLSNFTGLQKLEELILYENWLNDTVKVEVKEEFIDVSTFLKMQQSDDEDVNTDDRQQKFKYENKIVREFSKMFSNVDKLSQLNKIKRLQIVGCDNTPQLEFFKNISDVIIKRRSWE